jgi:plasmid stabilization system protein ParE
VPQRAQTTVVYSARALADLDRLFDFLASEDPPAASHAAAVIVDAVSILARHPYIGRPASGLLRELVISHGRSGYVALYRVSPRRDRVEVLALRHQREAGYHG